MEFLFLVALFSGIAGLIAKAIKGQRRRTEDVWKDAASRLGFAFLPGSLLRSGSIQGTLHDNSVDVDTYTRSTGSGSQTRTRYRIYYPGALDLELRIRRRGPLAGLATWIGAQDIETGDAHFDSRVVVKGTDPRRVAEFLTASRRQCVLRLFRDFPECEVSDHVIEWSRQGKVKRADEIVSTVRRLAFAAAQLRADSESERPRDHAVEVPELPKEDPKLVREEPPYARPGPEPEPAAAEVRVEPPAPDPEPVPAATGLEAATVCDELFASGLMGFEARRLFDERFKDRSVRWSGELRRVTSYQIDLVFRGAPGTKIELDLECGLPSAFGSTVHAIVQLPEEALEGLDTRIGERVTFEGRLASCDAMMRRLFVAAGNLRSSAP